MKEFVPVVNKLDEAYNKADASLIDSFIGKIQEQKYRIENVLYKDATHTSNESKGPLKDLVKSYISKNGSYQIYINVGYETFRIVDIIKGKINKNSGYFDEAVTTIKKIINSGGKTALEKGLRDTWLKRELKKAKNAGLDIDRQYSYKAKFISYNKESAISDVLNVIKDTLIFNEKTGLPEIKYETGSIFVEVESKQLNPSDNSEKLEKKLISICDIKDRKLIYNIENIDLLKVKKASNEINTSTNITGDATGGSGGAGGTGDSGHGGGSGHGGRTRRTGGSGDGKTPKPATELAKNNLTTAKTNLERAAKNINAAEKDNKIPSTVAADIKQKATNAKAAVNDALSTLTTDDTDIRQTPVQ